MNETTRQTDREQTDRPRYVKMCINWWNRLCCKKQFRLKIKNG